MITIVLDLKLNKKLTKIGNNSLPSWILFHGNIFSLIICIKIEYWFEPIILSVCLFIAIQELKEVQKVEIRLKLRLSVFLIPNFGTLKNRLSEQASAIFIYL